MQTIAIKIEEMKYIRLIFPVYLSGVLCEVINELTKYKFIINAKVFKNIFKIKFLKTISSENKIKYNINIQNLFLKYER